MEKLGEGLRYFRSNLLWQKRELFAECLWGQRPFAMLLATSDSQPLVAALRQLAPRDLFIGPSARSLGSDSRQPPNDAVAIENAIVRMGVTDLVVCSHYRQRPTVAPASAPLHGPASRDGWLLLKTKAILEHYASPTKQTRCEAVESGVLQRLRKLARQPEVASQVEAGFVRLHAWTICLESGQLYTHSPEHGRFVPLLEVPIIRSVAPAQALCRLARTRKKPLLAFDRNARYLAASAFALLGLAFIEARAINAAPRIQGGPPACACLTQGDDAIAPCSEDCREAITEDEAPSQINTVSRMVAWR